MSMTISAADRNVLRELAKQVAEVAALPIMAERRRLWKKFNALKPERAMILVFPEGSWREIKSDWRLQCEDEEARRGEDALRTALWTHRNMDTDIPVEGIFHVTKTIGHSGWGLEAKWHWSDQETGARTFDPVIHSPADLKKLRYPEATHDEKTSARDLSLYQDAIGDILEVRPRGMTHVGFGLMDVYTGLRGLEQVMLDMYENPGMIHEAMTFLSEGYRRLRKQYMDLGLQDLNNDNSYNNSGGLSYSDELPQKDFDGVHVRPQDLWACAQAQELTLVSPEMHEEFVLQYERRLLAPYGLTAYGCCEDLTHKLDLVLTVPNMRRISISPWADVDRCAAKLKGNCIFSWKPHPAHMVGQFKPQMIRDYIRHTLEVCRDNGCALEMILKDTHSCSNHPERFAQWTRIARELVEEFAAQ